jgi:hypothetical protein
MTGPAKDIGRTGFFFVPGIGLADQTAINQSLCE